MVKSFYHVNVVIVTYNRIELLKQTIKGIVEQTYPVNKIIVINNASTDGTELYLEKLSKTEDRLIARNMKKNLGGAGGFHDGIAEAYRAGCDFIWIMDDDCICSNNALEELINAYQIISSNRDRIVGFLSSDVRYKDGQPCIMNIPGPAYIFNEFVAKGIIQITYTSFVAMLIPSSIVKEVGLPYKEYFIWGDDGEYSTRILQKYQGYLVGTSVVYHYMNENKGVNIFDTPPERIERFYFFYRNWMYTRMSRSKKDGLRCFLEKIILILRILFSNTQYKWKKVGTVWRGTWAGILFHAEIDYV